MEHAVSHPSGCIAGALNRCARRNSNVSAPPGNRQRATDNGQRATCNLQQDKKRICLNFGTQPTHSTHSIHLTHPKHSTILQVPGMNCAWSYPVSVAWTPTALRCANARAQPSTVRDVDLRKYHATFRCIPQSCKLSRNSPYSPQIITMLGTNKSSHLKL